MKVEYLSSLNLDQIYIETITAGNFSYPSSAAAVVFGVHFSAQSVFRLDRKSPAIRPCV